MTDNLTSLSSSCHSRSSSFSSSSGLSSFVQPVQSSYTYSKGGAGSSVAPAPRDGLVPYETSVRGGSLDRFGGVEVDPHQSRLRRMRTSVRTSARLISDDISALPERFRAYMVTLTYRPGVSWHSYHISRCIRAYRSWASRLGFVLPYVWVSEIMENRYKNGALLGECVHYHVIFWVPARFSLPKADKAGFWKHGYTHSVFSRKPVGYITKYASKGSNVPFPKGIRTHGAGGLSKKSRNERTWWLLPQWVRALFPSPSYCPRRQVGGGFVSRVTGKFVQSIYSVLHEAGRTYFWLRPDLREVFSRDDLFWLACAGVISDDPDLYDDVSRLWDSSGSLSDF